MIVVGDINGDYGGTDKATGNGTAKKTNEKFVPLGPITPSTTSTSGTGGSFAVSKDHTTTIILIVVTLAAMAGAYWWLFKKK